MLRLFAVLNFCVLQAYCAVIQQGSPAAATNPIDPMGLFSQFTQTGLGANPWASLYDVQKQQELYQKYVSEMTSANEDLGAAYQKWVQETSEGSAKYWGQIFGGMGSPATPAAAARPAFDQLQNMPPMPQNFPTNFLPLMPTA